MVSAYRNSEVPMGDLEKTKQHHSMLTSSLAILTVCDSIREILTERLENQKPQANEDELVEKITLPVQVLELLVCN